MLVYGKLLKIGERKINNKFTSQNHNYKFKKFLFLSFELNKSMKKKIIALLVFLLVLFFVNRFLVSFFGICLLRNCSHFNSKDLSQMREKIESQIKSSSKYKELGGKNLKYKYKDSDKLGEYKCICEGFNYIFEDSQNNKYNIYSQFTQDFERQSPIKIEELFIKDYPSVNVDYDLVKDEIIDRGTEGEIIEVKESIFD